MTPRITPTQKTPKRQKNACPLNGNCLQSSLIYQATVTRKDNSTTETYIGLTENDFKTRYRNHTASFRHTNLRNSTELTASISGLLKKITLTTIFHGASFHQDRPTTLRTKDATSVSNKNCFNALSTVPRENRLADFLYIYIHIYLVSYLFIFILGVFEDP